MAIPFQGESVVSTRCEHSIDEVGPLVLHSTPLSLALIACSSPTYLPALPLRLDKSLHLVSMLRYACPCCKHSS